MDFIKEFTDRAVPNLQDICKRVGVSRCSSSRKLYDFLLQKEAFLGYRLMQKVKLSGIVEADGTALKLYRRRGHNNFIALCGLAERAQNQNPARMVVYMMRKQGGRLELQRLGACRQPRDGQRQGGVLTCDRRRQAL